MRVNYLYAVNLVAAFLLFQIELIISKILLPQFGGSYLVWGACVVFFQCVLLFGYVYAHAAVQMAGMYRYKIVHLALILSPLMFFPGRPLNVQPNSGLPMVMDIFLQLSMSIGLVFFILSTISLITQSWLAASELPERVNPYKLYAVSNVGSFLALLTYPFLFEYYFDINQQLMFWRIGYIVFILIYTAAFFSIKVAQSGELSTEPASDRSWRGSGEDVDFKVWWRCFLLSAAGSVIFLSVTNVITYEMAPCPLLWVVPLAVYLLSFVFVFQDKPMYPRWIVDRQFVILGFCAALFFLTRTRFIPAVLQFSIYVLTLFLLCLVCQHELYSSRPRSKQRLTWFYVIISAGSFIGGVLVTWVAPLVFSSPAEYLLGLLLMSLGLALSESKGNIGLGRMVLVPLLIGILLIWPSFYVQYKLLGVVILVGSFIFIFYRLQARPLAMPLMFCSLLGTVPFFNVPGSPLSYVEMTRRNYYGIYYVSDMPDKQRFFLHGMTVHGIQMRDPLQENEPTTYYHIYSPVGKYMSSADFRPNRIGIVGLGAGTLASYGREGQVFDFYELDPDVQRIAVSRFSFLKNSKANIRFYYGDARINLNRSKAVYDVLIVDAFSGDSVPAHLLTTEALLDYKRHLVDGGIMLFHVTNRYFDLVPVLFSNAKALGAYALVDINPRMGLWAYGSTWVAVTWSPEGREALISKLGWKDNNHGANIRNIRPWTDSYSHLFTVLIKQNLWATNP